MIHSTRWLLLVMLAAFVAAPSPAAEVGADDGLLLENEWFALRIDSTNGAITSLVVKPLDTDMIGEKRLAANFRICLPLPGHIANYIEGTEQTAAAVERTGTGAIVRFNGDMRSPQGEFPIDLEYTIELAGDEIRFRSRLTNHSEHALSEFWFPRIGGWTHFDPQRNATLQLPTYMTMVQNHGFFRHFPGNPWFGAEAAEFQYDYPGLVMPWWQFYDPQSDHGLYMGYHDPTFRFSTWHTYLFPNITGLPHQRVMTPQQAADEPIGIVFSHVRYPQIHSGETFESGEFIIRIHRGDWRTGSLRYREWFLQHFPLDNSGSWLRQKDAWFSSILYQPEDKVVADYETYNQWTREAEQFGIDTFELIGWDKGGLERDYPEYIPEEKLGGREGFRELLRDVRDRGSHLLVFINYNVLDSSSELFRERLHEFAARDIWGNPYNGHAWGQSTLLARKNITARRHVVASITPEFEALMDSYLIPLVEDGAQAFQIDKAFMHAMDFNPISPEKPDVALYQGHVDAIGRLLEKAQRINPDFRIASEAVVDRFLPHVDVYYRASHGASISPLRYVFPEWTSVNHLGTPFDYNTVNGSIVTGAIICVQPQFYQAPISHPLYREIAEYTKEVLRIRRELRELIFTGRYYDTLGAAITELAQQEGELRPVPASGEVVIGVHGRWDSPQRAIVLANIGAHERHYRWGFTHRDVPQATLYIPFAEPRTVRPDEPLTLKPYGLHILVE